MNHHLFSLLLLHIRNITVFCNAYLPTLATAYFIFADFITFGLHSKCDSVCFTFINYIFTNLYNTAFCINAYPLISNI